MLVSGVEIQDPLIVGNRVLKVVNTHTETDWKGNITITVTYKDFMTGEQVTETMYRKIVED